MVDLLNLKNMDNFKHPDNISEMLCGSADTSNHLSVDEDGITSDITDVSVVSAHLHESTLSPVTPLVLDDPVVATILIAITNSEDGVVASARAGSLEDSSAVSLEVTVDVDGNSNWSVHRDGFHEGVLITMGLNGPPSSHTGRLRLASSATGLVVTLFIRVVALVGESVVSHVVEGWDESASSAAVVAISL